MKYKKDWFLFTQFPDRFKIGDRRPSGTCHLIADFTPRPCVTGCGDETPSEAEALENVVLASQAPALLTALRRLLEAPALNMDDLEPFDVEAIDAATRACELADPYPGPPPGPPETYVFVAEGSLTSITDRDGNENNGTVAIIDFDTLPNMVCPVCHQDFNFEDLTKKECPTCSFNLQKGDIDDALRAAHKLEKGE